MANDFVQLETLGKHPGWHTEPILAISQLKVGDLIQGQLLGETYRVRCIKGDGRVFAVRELEITNPDEWRLVVKQLEGVGDGST